MWAVGVRGPDELRWCPCGNHLLEKIGVYATGRVDAEGTPIPEYSHVPLCPTCQDELVEA